MPSPQPTSPPSVPASVLQPFRKLSVVYLPSSPISSRLTSSYIMTSAMLSNAAFVTSLTRAPLMSHTHTTAFPSCGRNPSASCGLNPSRPHLPCPRATSRHRFPIPQAIQTKPANPQKSKTCPPVATEAPSNKRGSRSPDFLIFLLITLQTSPASPLSGPHKKNCVLNASSAFELLTGGPSYNSLSVHKSKCRGEPTQCQLEALRTDSPGAPSDPVRHVALGRQQ